MALQLNQEGSEKAKWYELIPFLRAEKIAPLKQCEPISQEWEQTGKPHQNHNFQQLSSYTLSLHSYCSLLTNAQNA